MKKSSPHDDDPYDLTTRRMRRTEGHHQVDDGPSATSSSSTTARQYSDYHHRSTIPRRRMSNSHYGNVHCDALPPPQPPSSSTWTTSSSSSSAVSSLPANNDNFIDSFDDDFLRDQQRILDQIQKGTTTTTTMATVEDDKAVASQHNSCVGIVSGNDTNSTASSSTNSSRITSPYPTLLLDERNVVSTHPVQDNRSKMTWSEQKQRPAIPHQTNQMVSAAAAASRPLEHDSNNYNKINVNCNRTRCVTPFPPPPPTSEELSAQHSTNVTTTSSSNIGGNDAYGNNVVGSDGGIMVDNENVVSFTDFMQDAELIRQQVEILNQIEEHQKMRRTEQLLEENNNGSFVVPSNQGSSSITSSSHRHRRLPPRHTSLQQYTRDTTNNLNQNVAMYYATDRSSRSQYGAERSSTELPTTTNVRRSQTSSYAGRIPIETSTRNLVSTEPDNGRATTSRMDDVFSTKADMTMKRSSSSSSSSSILHHHQQHQLQDQVLKVGDKKLHVKGTKDTYQSIADGNAIIVQCPSCSTFLQISSKAKNLYCVMCQNVTSVALAKDQTVVLPRQLISPSSLSSSSSSSMRRVGGATSHDNDDDELVHDDGYDPLTLDSQIAHSLQNQERDIACARKLDAVASAATATTRSNNSNTIQRPPSPPSNGPR